MLPALLAAPSMLKILKWVAIPVLIIGIALAIYFIGRKDEKIKHVEETNEFIEKVVEKSEKEGEKADKLRDTVRRSREVPKNTDAYDDLKRRALFYSCLLEANTLENKCAKHLQ